MKAEIKPSTLSGATGVVTSKSYYIRALLLAALADAPVNLLGLNECGDVKAAISVITALGATVEKTAEGYRVTPVEKWPTKVEIDVGESATLLRLVVPILAAKGVESTVTAADSLKKRPVNSLVKPLSEHGVTFTRKMFPLKFSGQLQAGKYTIIDNSTSGVISGLLIALSTLSGNSEISADINSFNKGYIDITIDILNAFGHGILCAKNRLIIEGNAHFSARDYTVETDWSNAAAWLVAGALAGDVTIKGLNLVSAQFDRKIIDFLSQMGAEFSMTDNTISVKKSTLMPISEVMNKNIDVVPVLAAAAATANGVSVLHDIERLALKESNRIDEIRKLLATFSIKTEYENGNLKIYGGKLVKTGDYVAPNDHRIIMAATILGTVTGLNIDNIDGIDKSYPKFFKDYAKLGGKVICQ